MTEIKQTYVSAKLLTFMTLWRLTHTKKIQITS